ncbi:MAG: TonB-dependent receptor domain-containing protein [Ignavibacteriales bacterium]
MPIAMSAFTQEDLTRSQVAGGPDLMTQVPNFTFTKTNFSGYSIQIRGIGTQAISATTDAAVAVAFNNTPFIRNRFFEQEFYDLQRVEVLRGPQGTLYGRNATAGAVNIISAKPKFTYEAKLSADVGNYNSNRLEGMINVPLVEDKVALRIAGAWTKRDGYDTNQLTGNRIDGRDLWSTRLSLRLEPADNIHANLIWEHFQENDDRLRSGKQLCHTHNQASIGSLQLTPDASLGVPAQVILSQGCAPASLYAPESFETPNGLSLPYYFPLSWLALPTTRVDPFLSNVQSRDLRTIESTVDPQYRAKTDTAELQLAVDIGDHLTLTTETGYLSDRLFSMEDYNRFNTAPGAWGRVDGWDWINWDSLYRPGPNGWVFCDPQIGCSDRLVVLDLSAAKSRQFSQEFRLSSDYQGPFNFSLGANFLRYDTEDKYYVFINSVGLVSALSPNYNRRTAPPYVPGQTDNSQCLTRGLAPADVEIGAEVGPCTYMDPNPLGSLNDQGHNYFLSRNPYKLISYALFGEAYYDITPDLKVTAGLRWTVDQKRAPRIPSWLLASNSAGQPVAEVINQTWREPTGRLTLNWKPDLRLTDETLFYASYAHGYKAGGANPPGAGITCYLGCAARQEFQNLFDQSTAHPKTFAPEFVNAFEIGAKNTLAEGSLTLNADAFYYDYTGYQISQIVDRSAVNLNFDAQVWGAEIESEWRPSENLRLGFKGGYENTRVANGMKAIDLMDRTAGNKDWVVVRPFPTYTSNCILPAWLFIGRAGASSPDLAGLGGGVFGGNPGGCELAYQIGYDPVTGNAYTPFPYGPDQPPLLSKDSRTDVNYAAWNSDLSHYPGWPTGVPLGTEYPGVDPRTVWAESNHGQGFFKDLSGNELPNAPHFTATVTADYTVPLPHEWLMTLHGDLYYQSEAWARIFNTPGYDKLKAYSNVNLAAIFSNEDAGWKVMAYVKNVFDHDAITGAFLNSDDTGLTTNVFLNEPRLYGLRVTKEWTGQGWWTGANPDHTGPYPFTVEVSGHIHRVDAPYDPVVPSFLDSFSVGLRGTGVQNRRLDRGDGREVKLSYAPPAGSWTLSADLRYGRVNGSTRNHAEEKGDGGCLSHPFPPYIPADICDPSYSGDGGGNYLRYGTNSADQAISTHEEHAIAEFSVGRDVGLGGGANKRTRSAVSAGLRYADFKSKEHFSFKGVPDWNFPDYWLLFKYAQHHRDTADIAVERTFEGFGPTVAWDGGLPIWEGEGGQVNLDWTIKGGVLFGRQKTAASGQEAVAYYTGKYNHPPGAQVGPTIYAAPPASRSKAATVPVLSLGLGLSYEIQRIKLSTGYRWERYFNAIDGGYAEHKSYDRTIDGPYFKIAVGFGG